MGKLLETEQKDLLKLFLVAPKHHNPITKHKDVLVGETLRELEMEGVSVAVDVDLRGQRVA